MSVTLTWYTGAEGTTELSTHSSGSRRGGSDWQRVPIRCLRCQRVSIVLHIQLLLCTLQETTSASHTKHCIALLHSTAQQMICAIEACVRLHLVRTLPLCDWFDGLQPQHLQCMSTTHEDVVYRSSSLLAKVVLPWFRIIVIAMLITDAHTATPPTHSTYNLSDDAFCTARWQQEQRRQPQCSRCSCTCACH